MLTDEQKNFLNHYLLSKGDFYTTVETMGLEVVHVQAWRDNSPEFEQIFNQYRQRVILALKEENYILALRGVNDVIKNGHYVTVTTTEKDDNMPSGEATKTVVKEDKHPQWAYKLAINEDSISRAVGILASEGILPPSIAKRVVQSAGRIQDEVIKAFGTNEDEESLNDKKLAALIKKAVLGSNND